MSFGLLKNVFPNFGEGGKIQQSFLEHNYQQILEKESTIQPVESSIQPVGSSIQPVESSIPKIEKFEGGGHEKYQQQYFQHIMSCDECKKLLMRQLENNSQKNGNFDETIIEMGMYVLFGVFILALLDTK